jgi:hypothetical protein
MNISVIVIASLIVALSSPAMGQMMSLTDAQMDGITAGTFGDDRRNLTADQDAVVSQDMDGTVSSQVVNNGLNAQNVASVSETSANISDVDNSRNTVVLGGDVQEHARGVSMVNGIGNKVAVGLNTNAVIDRGLGDLSRPVSSSHSIGSVPSSLNQSNIMIQR